MAIQNNAWASGSPDSWLQGMPTTQTESGAPQLDFYGDINVPGSPADVPTGGAQPPGEGVMPVEQMQDWMEQQKQEDWLANLTYGQSGGGLLGSDQYAAQSFMGNQQDRDLYTRLMGMQE